MPRGMTLYLGALELHVGFCANEWAVGLTASLNRQWRQIDAFLLLGPCELGLIVWLPERRQ